MFANCANLETLDIQTWDMSGALPTNMLAGCNNLTTLILGYNSVLYHTGLSANPGRSSEDGSWVRVDDGRHAGWIRKDELR